jgi:hypothetical protein
LIESGAVDRIVRYVQRLTEAPLPAVEDAVAVGIEKLVRRFGRGQVDDVGAWLAEVAKNEVLRGYRDPATVPLDKETSSGDDPAADVMVRELLRLIKHLLEGWENRNLATVTGLYIEAAFLGEPLSLAEARQFTEQILGESVSYSSIGTWKQRGLKRLADELTALDLRKTSRPGGKE